MWVKFLFVFRPNFAVENEFITLESAIERTHMAQTLDPPSCTSSTTRKDLFATIARNSHWGFPLKCTKIPYLEFWCISGETP